MKIEFYPSKSAVRVKSRRYPSNQRVFLKAYIEKLVEMGFFIPNPDATRQAASLCVPKAPSKSKFRMAIDLRPVNAATIKKESPMPHIHPK